MVGGQGTAAACGRCLKPPTAASDRDAALDLEFIKPTLSKTLFRRSLVPSAAASAGHDPRRPVPAAEMSTMLTAGAYAEPGVRHCLAPDMGSSTVRLWTPATATVLRQPTVLALPSGGRHVTGQAALAEDGGAVATWPVRDGVVRDFFACVHLLRLLTADAGLPADVSFPVLVGVPATATLRKRNVLVAAVRRAVGGRVTPVAEPLAAALACGTSARDGDVIVVDIGSGRTEVVRVADGRVTAAERVDNASQVDRIPAIADCVRRLDGFGNGRRRRLITGGGAASPGSAARLAALTGRPVTVPADPALATLIGLRLLLTGRSGGSWSTASATALAPVAASPCPARKRPRLACWPSRRHGRRHRRRSRAFGRRAAALSEPALGWPAAVPTDPMPVRAAGHRCGQRSCFCWQGTQNRACGSTSSRSAGIGLPHLPHLP